MGRAPSNKVTIRQDSYDAGVLAGMACRQRSWIGKPIKNRVTFIFPPDSKKPGAESTPAGRQEVVMSSFVSRLWVMFLMMTFAGAIACNAGDRAGVALPSPTVDAAIASARGEQTAVVAGGCFWGVQAVFQHVKGVINATSGYSGGAANTAAYELVSTGETGHAESVKITYDPSQITYGQLLRVFFSVAHDPTQLNRQGPDTGTQYRSAIFYSSDEQKGIAEAYIAQLEKAKLFARPIVTQVVALKAFYPAEAYHQDYAAHHPDSLYIVYNDAPKVAHLRQQFPALYAGK
jgi:peptide-methionine (S)-S-oxide reductase